MADNGGWINVWAVGAGSPDAYLGQVYGDMKWMDFVTDAMLLTIRLEAFPDNIQRWSFLNCEGYSPGISSITVLGQGTLPMANFYCDDPVDGALQQRDRATHLAPRSYTAGPSRPTRPCLHLCGWSLAVTNRG